MEIHETGPGMAGGEQVDCGITDENGAVGRNEKMCCFSTCPEFSLS
jgi:hypothetical protein